ncbi:MAG TPA: penicillin acylase family protein [Verrucomicrobiae bacterium]|nr:penicillin acylase family protein [Verrucomicrobiae bacterium]
MKKSIYSNGIPALGLLRRVVWVVVVQLLAGFSVRAANPVPIAGLHAEARIVRDAQGVPHVTAQNEHDLFFLQAYAQAEDRLLQMDVSRRLGSGRLAELLGEGALAMDVQLRTIGLHRAAERTLAVLSPRVRAALEAYADGVNAFVATHPLSPEYGALELTHFESWTPLDSVIVAKLITFQRSFELDIESTITLLSYQQAGQAVGFDGAALYFEDLFRSAPFDPAVTIPDAINGFAAAAESGEPATATAAGRSHKPHPALLKLCRDYLGAIRDLPVFRNILDRDKHAGSNEWGISGAHTTSGHAMLANDTHLQLGMPNLFHPIHIQAGQLNAAGSSVAGVPFVVLGQNRRLCWGGSVNYVDVTDTFQEQIVPDPNSPSGLSIVHQGQNEPIIPIPEVFRKNNFDGVPDNLTVVAPGGDIPPATLIVPRRNNGPIVRLDLAGGTALSVQYTGFGATRELETFLIWNEARGLEDFVRGVQFFDVGSINWACADVRGNIAFFSSSAVPIREDLQAGQIHGLPPTFIRDGTGGNEWLPVQHPQPGQVVPYEILSFEEMPHLINPPAGWFANSNNDPLGQTLDNNPFNQLRPGGGIFYLSSAYETYRAGRVTQLIREKLAGGGKISFHDMQQIQADTALIDAQVFVPYILQAHARARSSTEPVLAALANEPSLASAVQRLATWNFTTPTGLREGYDASDGEGALLEPSSNEVAASVAATIYSVWRGQVLRNTIDAPLAPFGLPLAEDQHALVALRHLLETFPSRGGVGASGINFFNVPAVASPEDRRDVLILKSLDDALALLAGDAFAPAFAHSSNLDDYRWGKLHRLVLNHPLGGALNVPPALGLWPAPLPGLAGIPVDGGFNTVDVGNPIGGIRAASADAFMFDHGPAHRFIGEATPSGVQGELSEPGGVSGVPGSVGYVNLLDGWLRNDSFPLQLHSQPAAARVSCVRFVPAQ